MSGLSNHFAALSIQRDDPDQEMDATPVTPAPQTLYDHRQLSDVESDDEDIPAPSGAGVVGAAEAMRSTYDDDRPESSKKQHFLRRYLTTEQMNLPLSQGALTRLAYREKAKLAREKEKLAQKEQKKQQFLRRYLTTEQLNLPVPRRVLRGMAFREKARLDQVEQDRQLAAKARAAHDTESGSQKFLRQYLTTEQMNLPLSRRALKRLARQEKERLAQVEQDRQLAVETQTALDKEKGKGKANEQAGSTSAGEQNDPLASYWDGAFDVGETMDTESPR